jgi:hypothetical protein
MRGALDVASEVIENRLPALALLLDRMGRFAVECNAHFDTPLTWGELDRATSSSPANFPDLFLMLERALAARPARAPNTFRRVFSVLTARTTFRRCMLGARPSG